MTRRKGLILAAQVTVLVAACAGAVAASEPADWHPLGLAIVLFALAVGSDVLTVEARGVRISGAFLAIVLAMVLLGPAPAVAVGAGSAFVDALLSRRPWNKALNNVATYAAFPLVGGLLMDAAVEPGAHRLWFATAVLGVFMATNVLNFLLVASFHRACYGHGVIASFRTVYLTVLPSELATGLLTAALAWGYLTVGTAAIGLATLILFVFQYMVRAGVQLHDRGEELSDRTRQLASLQVGLLSTVLQTLSMRDAMTARHSAAVARYSREIARELGLPEREQELVHTAALLHDIGKFIFPDSILFAARKLTDEEWATVKLHPEQGARLVRRIEGYGPVAEIIHAHHERVDGRGYPRGLPAEEIPLGSRIISVADTYDVMTSRDSYRRPVSTEAAVVELRRVSGSQLDGAVVDAFLAALGSGRVAFRHHDEADFEQELAFERRVADYARPRLAA